MMFGRSARFHKLFLHFSIFFLDLNCHRGGVCYDGFCSFKAHAGPENDCMMASSELHQIWETSTCGSFKDQLQENGGNPEYLHLSCYKNFLHLCPHCWKLSFTHLSLLLHLSRNYQQKIKSRNLNCVSHDPLRLGSTPASPSSVSHLFTPFLSTFLIQHKCRPDVRQQSLKEDIQNDKAIKGEERESDSEQTERSREGAPPSFHPSFNPVRILSPSIFPPSYQNNRHSGRLMKLVEMKERSICIRSVFHAHI